MSENPEKVDDMAGVHRGAFSPAFWRLMDMDLSVSISLGRAELALQDVLRLTTGSIIELNRSVGDAVDVVVNDRVVARGEVVVVNGSYGVRVQELVAAASSELSPQKDAPAPRATAANTAPESGAEPASAPDWGLE